MLLRGGLITVGYLLLKGSVLLINESDIKFSIPKGVERLSYGFLALTVQTMFF